MIKIYDIISTKERARPTASTKINQNNKKKIHVLGNE